MNTCDHVHFEVYQNNRVGFGQCLDCDQEVNLAILFGNLAKRLQTLEVRLTERLNGETSKAQT